MPTELAEDVWWFDLGGVNVYLVDDGGTLTLIDAGTPWQGGRIVDGLRELGFGVADLDRVLVTHYDLDHVGGLTDLGGLTATIHVGAGDAPYVAGDRSPPAFDRKGLFQRLSGLFVDPPGNPVESVADGDRVGSFTVFETPGHTPGHVAYVSEELSLGVLGDLVREDGGRLAASPWFLSADTGAVRDSVRDLSGRSPDFEAAAMGHGTPFSRGGKDRLDELAGRL
jgi:glyoxylase-like metal-dependent hydrolase (beta-lactamase superfamily II)